MKRQFVIVGLCAVLGQSCATPEPAETATAAAADGKVLAVGDMTWQDIDALDRDKAVFLLVVGMLEEHGPHLPIAADTIGVEHEAGRVAERVRQSLPGWRVVVMPTIHYGSSGVNQVGNVAVHPGTYAIRQSTLRSIVADIGGQIAQNRFKRVFVMTGHGAPTNHAAINQACDFVSDVFDATMLNISALFSADPVIQARGEAITAKYFSPADRSSFGIDAHAGVSETSGVLAVRPDLVRPGYRTLPSHTAESRPQMQAIASQPGWPGYFSSPARADAAYGRDIETWWSEGMSDLILQSVRGEDLRGRPRWPEPIQSDPAYASIIQSVVTPEREFDAKFERWLAAQKNQ